MKNTLPPEVQNVKSQGHKIVLIETEGNEFYFRKPTKTEIMFYQDETLKNKGSITLHSEKFLRKLFVGANAEVFSQYLDEKPLALGNFLEELLKDMGADVNFTATEI
ncbi:MAG: hypothetical protein ACRC0X_01910 [Brevinema sp.]